MVIWSLTRDCSYMQGYCDQQALLNTGLGREMLTETFKGLTNLETVDIRDFCARRERDNTFWNSWGATTVYHDTGVRLRHCYREHALQQPFISNVLSILLYSLGMARRSLPRLEISLHSRVTCLPETAFHIASFTLPTVMPVLQNLTALFLPLNFSQTSHILNSHGSTAASYFPLRHFLTCTPNLVHLRLNFYKSQLAEPVNADFLQWLAAVPTFATAPGPTQITTSPQGKERPSSVLLSHLTALDLGQLVVTEKLLLDLLHKFAPTLRHLSLWRISIYAGRPGLDDSKPNAWSHFFKRLAAVPELQLAYLKVGALSQVDALNHQPCHTTKFLAQEQATISREFTGSTEDMARFVASLAQDVAVDWPQPMIEDDGNDDTSNSDNEDMDDDGEDEEEDEGDEEEDGEEGTVE